MRLRLLDVPLERDEGEYAYAGQLLLEGVPPYRLAYNMKLPGTYAAYALIMAVLGQTPRGIHLGLLIVNAATAALIFLLARRLFDGWTAAAAGGAFVVLSLSQRVLGVFAHATHFVLLPAIAGTVVLLRALDDGTPADGARTAGAANTAGSGKPAGRGRAAAVFCAGLLFGLAFLMKQHGLFFVLFAAAWLLLEMLRRRERPGRIARACGLLAAGTALPFALTCALLARAGVFGDFWFWTFDYARAYVTQVPLGMGLQLFVEMARVVAAPTLPVWILAGAGLTAPLWDKEVRARSRFLLAFALFSFASICPGLFFREHYFVLLLPAAAILAAAAAGALGRALARGLLEPVSPGRDRLAAGVMLPVVAAALLYPVAAERAFFFSLTPRQASRAAYGPNPFPEAVEIARRIAADTRPEDRVAVLGSEPEIYFYARRRSASGHIYMYGLMEDHPHARAMQQEAIREIEASAPACIVFVNVPQSWLGRPTSDPALLNWARAYLTEHYRVAGVADIRSDAETVYAWGESALDYRPLSPYVVYLFRRVS